MAHTRPSSPSLPLINIAAGRRTVAALGLAAALGSASALGTGCNDDRVGNKADMATATDGDVSTTPHACTVGGPIHQLSNLTGQHAYPRIATNGLGYVVAWLSGLPGSTPSFRIDAT